MRNFHMAAFMFTTRQGIKARSHKAVSCFPGPDNAPRWEMYDFHMGMGSCYNTIKLEHLTRLATDVHIQSPVAPSYDKWYRPMDFRQEDQRVARILWWRGDRPYL